MSKGEKSERNARRVEIAKAKKVARKTKTARRAK
jgi:hypothetical protein